MYRLLEVRDSTLSNVWEELGRDKKVLFHSTSDPCHTWIEFDGLHYDIENPDGATDWRRLSHFNGFKNVRLDAENPQTHFEFYQKDAKRIAAVEAKQKACDDWLAELDIRRNDLEVMNNAANASTENAWKLLKGYYDVPLEELIPDEGDDWHHHTDRAGKQRIENLAKEIVANGWIEAVIVEYEHPPDGEPQYTLIEGQHRARAMRYLGCSKVVAQVYEVLWEK